MIDLADTGLVIVAAGQGRRFGGPKQLAEVRGEPLLLHTVRAFAHCRFAQRVLVLPPGLFDDGTWLDLQSKYGAFSYYEGIPGGKARAHSVRLGLMALTPTCKYVAVHDGARPLPPIDCLVECHRRLEADPSIAAAVVSAPATDTLKEVAGHASGRVARTIDRTRILRAETPQLARREELLKALSTERNPPPSDEAQALELAGKFVICVLHEGLNIKVTHPEDLALFEALLHRRKES